LKADTLPFFKFVLQGLLANFEATRIIVGFGELVHQGLDVLLRIFLEK
jgi:hypothetical protein